MRSTFRILMYLKKGSSNRCERAFNVLSDRRRCNQTVQL